MISTRQKLILEQLIEQQDFNTVEQLAKKHDVSQRTIRHDILSLELFLKHKDIKFIRDRKKGLKIEVLNDSWEKLKNFLDQNEQYMSPEDRLKAISRLLLIKSEVDFEELLEEFKISDKTLTADLTELKSWFLERELKLSREKGKVIVKGRELYKRRAYLLLIKEEASGERILDYILNDNSKVANVLKWKDWFQPKEIVFLSEVVLQMEEALSIGFTDDGYVALILHMYLSTERLKKEHFVAMDELLLSELDNLREFQIVEQIVRQNIEPYFGVTLPKSEIGYITQHVLTAQRNYVKDREDEECLNFAREIVIEVEKKFQKPLAMSNQIISNLAMHLKPAIYRYKYDKQIFNPLFDGLKKELGSLMEDIFEITNRVFIKSGIHFNEHEASYIAMHIGAGLRNTVSTMSPKRVAIACSSGLGTANILKRKLLDMYPKINIVKKCSYKDLKDLTYADVDIVISTIDIYYNLQVPWIKVSPILTKEDEERVINLLGLPEALDEREFEIVNSVNDIIKIVEQHATIENRISLSQQLIHFFKGTHNRGQGKNGSCKLEDILPLDSILVNQQPPKNINELIHLGTKPLQKRNLIGLEYEEKLSEMLANPKNHFMITEGVIFPHASSETGVWGTGMSFVTFSEPVKFDELAKPITIMITLAAVDSERHVNTLAIIIDALNDQSFMEMLKNSHTNRQIFEWFQRKEGSLL